MLLLGVLQAQAAGAVGVGSFDLLETQVLASSAASVTFSSLDTLAAGYKHLQVRMVARSDNASTNDTVQLTFNSDFGSNYSRHALVGNGSAVNSGGASSTTYIEGLIATGATAPANSFSAAVLDILDFSSSSKNTTTRSLNAWQTSQIRLDSGMWNNTSAVTSLALTPASGDFITGSRFSLYGIKAGA